jgi:hypothetical protein
VASLVFGGQVSVVVTLRGTYGHPGPPPTDFIIEEKSQMRRPVPTAAGTWHKRRWTMPKQCNAAGR